MMRRIDLLSMQGLPLLSTVFILLLEVKIEHPDCFQSKPSEVSFDLTLHMWGKKFGPSSSVDAVGRDRGLVEKIFL